MKRIFPVFMVLLLGGVSFSQDMTKFKLYKADDNADLEIKNAVRVAQEEGKHVFIQIGGNWCIWCARFDDFIKTDKKIDSLVKADFIVYHFSYSKENYNADLLAKYGYPQRFGFPVFLILDGNGKLIHTQNSTYLEDNKNYGRDKVIEFLMDWRPVALDPRQYKEQ